jgi:hypothetical protein
VYRTSCSFAGKCPHCRTTKSGGRKLPWHASILVQHETLGAAGTIPEPRRADGRRCWFCARYWPKIVRFCQQARPVTDPRRAGARRSCRTCICAPRMSLFFSEPVSRTRSGQHEPAVVVERFARAKRSRTFATIRMRPPRAAPGAAGLSQPWRTIRSRVVNVITRRKRIAIAGAVAEPRRADNRRSCKRAFVYRTSRSFVGKCPYRRTTKRGGRKPPVDSLRRLHRSSSSHR